MSGADIESISLTARRHALLDSRPVDVASVALAVLHSTNDKSSLPQRESLDAEQKRHLALVLKDKDHLSGANIGRLLGVTRQAVYGYLKQDDETQDG